MYDLHLGCAIIIVAAVGVFLGVARLARRLPPATLDWLALLTVAALIYYIREVWYDVRLSAWLPFSNLVVLGNWLPLLAAVLAALAWRRSVGWVRQGTLAGSLLLAGLYALINPLLGSAPQCENRWDSFGNCLQTTSHTCSPAAAATLLRAHGIAATEQEMAELCLTRQGTSWPGLYRGLKLKTAGTQWDVQIVDCPADHLVAQGPGPMILSVGLERGSRVDASFSEELGWTPGVNHSVVLLGFTPRGLAEIIDPSQPYAREQWRRDTLQTLWRGHAVRLVERQ